jgi:hypothetical protein
MLAWDGGCRTNPWEWASYRWRSKVWLVVRSSVHERARGKRSARVAPPEFGIPKVVVGESVNFSGGIDWLRQCGIEVVDLASTECMQLLAGFIAAHPELWQEDIGEQ